MTTLHAAMMMVKRQRIVYTRASQNLSHFIITSHTFFTDVMSSLQISIHYKISSRHIVIQSTYISHVWGMLKTYDCVFESYFFKENYDCKRKRWDKFLYNTFHLNTRNILPLVKTDSRIPAFI